MTVQIVRRDGYSELIQDVNHIEVDKESGKRIKLCSDTCKTEMPCWDFTSIIILREE